RDSHVSQKKANVGHQLLLLHELHFRLVGDDAGLVTHVEQAAHGFAAVVAVVERALVYIHADELVGHAAVEITRKLHGVTERVLAMVESVLNAFRERAPHAAHGFSAEVSANGVSAER